MKKLLESKTLYIFLRNCDARYIHKIQDSRKSNYWVKRHYFQESEPKQNEGIGDAAVCVTSNEFSLALFNKETVTRNISDVDDCVVLLHIKNKCAFCFFL